MRGRQILKKQNQSSICYVHKEPGAAAQTAVPTLRRQRQEEHKFQDNPNSLSKTLSPRMEEKRQFSYYSWDYYSIKKPFGEGEILLDSALWGYQAWSLRGRQPLGTTWMAVHPSSLLGLFLVSIQTLQGVSLGSTRFPKHRDYFLSAPQFSISHSKATQCLNSHFRHCNDFNFTCNSVLATSTAYLGPREPVVTSSSALLRTHHCVPGLISSKDGGAVLPSTWKPYL